MECGLVADEFVGAAAEADAGDAEDGGEGEEERVPIEHRVGEAGRVGEILAGPERDQRADDEALEAEDEEELATAAAAIEGFDFLRGEVAFVGGEDHVGHGCLVSCGWVLLVLNHIPGVIVDRRAHPLSWVRRGEADSSASLRNDNKSGCGMTTTLDAE